MGLPPTAAGARTRNIRLLASDLSGTRQGLLLNADVPASAVVE